MTRLLERPPKKFCLKMPQNDIKTENITKTEGDENQFLFKFYAILLPTVIDTVRRLCSLQRTDIQTLSTDMPTI